MLTRDIIAYCLCISVALMGFLLNGTNIVGLLAACIAIGLIGSALWLRMPFFPYDCICSATSVDGLHWILDKGVRCDVGGINRSNQVYYPNVISVGNGYRMYYGGSGDKSTILSAFSQDGLAWAEEEGGRVGANNRFLRLGCPDVMRWGNGYRMYYGGQDSTTWKIHWAESQDSLVWKERGCCLEAVAEEYLPHVKDPSVIRRNGNYQLFFMAFSKNETEIYTCFSSDGLAWSKPVPCRGYRTVYSSFVRNPEVVKLGNGQLRMYFAETERASALGSRIASAISTDGIHWQREEGFRLKPAGPNAGQGVFCPNVLQIDGEWKMFFGAYWKRHWLLPYTIFYHR